MAKRYSNKRIIKSFQTIPPGKLLPGMVVTFNYSEQGVTDPRPILLFLHKDPDTKNIEGLNFNYLSPTKLKKLFQVTDFKKTEVAESESIILLKEDYFRIQISTPKKRSAMTTKRFYGDVVSADNVFKGAYRSYKMTKLTALKVANIHLDYLQHNYNRNCTIICENGTLKWDFIGHKLDIYKIN